MNAAPHPLRAYQPSAKGIVVFVVLFGALAIAPIIFSDSYSLHFMWKVLFAALIAAAWNIAGGYAGQFSLGHAAFFGIGAYTSTLLFEHFQISPWFGMLAGGLLAMLFAAALALLTLRLKGPFLSLASIAFAEVVRIIIVNWRSFTGGSEGISIRFDPSFSNMMFSNRAWSVYILIGAVSAIYLLTHALERSPVGFRLAAMREDEDAAESLGVDTKRLKVQSFAVSAFLTALAGTFYANYILLIDPSSVLSVGFSIEIALICIIGGTGTAIGPLIGALLIVPLGEYLRAEFAGSLQGLYLLIYGTLLIVMVMFVPLGVVSAFRDPRAFWDRLRSRRSSRRRRVAAAEKAHA